MNPTRQIRKRMSIKTLGFQNSSARQRSASTTDASMFCWKKRVMLAMSARSSTRLSPYYL